MNQNCPRCNSANTGLARYCAQCGMWLPRGDASRMGGRINHPTPLPPPAGFQALPGAADLHYHVETGFGGPPLLGVESVRMTVFNGGYGLRNAVFELRLVTKDGRQPTSLLRDVETLQRGGTAVLDAPSYELPDLVTNVSVALISAELASNE